MKKILLSLALLTGVLCSSRADYIGKIGDCYYYTNPSMGTATAYGVSDDQTDSVSGDITIPATINYLGDDYQVVIGRFDDCKITSLTIEEGITEIGVHAFSGCKSLTSVSMPSSLRKIGAYAFSYSALTSITIPEGVEVLESSCFSNCNIPTLTLPSTLTTLGDKALEYIFTLTELVIPAKVDSIGSYAFTNCNQLARLTIKGNVTKLNPDAFCTPAVLEYIHVPEGTLANYDDVTCNKSKIEEFNPAKQGTINGKFTINASGDQVYFSQGNLQYVGTWQFAENQWDYFGNSQSDNHRDWFGWGTGDAPNKVSDDEADYADFHEWGDNPITNGGNEPNLWRTLTSAEWHYLLYTRTSAATLFAFGSVNDVNGLILLPDNWEKPEGASFTASTTQGLAIVHGMYEDDNNDHYLDNTYTIAQWEVMETSGAVFLPAAGGYGWSSSIGEAGFYWTSTPYPHAANGAYVLDFHSSSSCFINHYWSSGNRGHWSVRLVKDVPSIPTAVDNTAVENKAIKRLVNGQLLIIREGKTYNALGAEVK